MKLDYENLRDVVWISSPALSPDGLRAAWVRGISDYDSGEIRTGIQERNLETGQSWTPGLAGMCQKEPVYSPDGRYLAFLASDGRPWQVWVKDCQSGALRQLTRCRYGVSAPAWSRDGRSLAFEVKYYPAQPWETEEKGPGGWKKQDTAQTLLEGEFTSEAYAAFLERQKKEPKVFENLIYKLDSDYGTRDGSRTAIALCSPEDGAARLVSPLDQPYQIPSFVREDQELACYGYPYTHCRELEPELYLLNLRTGERRKVEKSIPSYYSFPVLEDSRGRLLYCGAHAQGEAVLPEPCAVSCGEGQSQFLFETWPVCHGLDPIYSGDAHLSQKDSPFVRDREGRIFFLSYAMGRSNLYCWDGERLYPVTDEDCVLDFSLSETGRLLVLKSAWNCPARLALLELRKDGKGRLQAAVPELFANENAWLEDFSLIEPRPLSVQSRDGKARIRGWAVVPEGASIPAVLDVHGGPEACYVNGFFYEAQMLAARGIAVLFCDPRGSAGYGPEFMSGSYAYGPEAVEDYAGDSGGGKLRHSLA